MEGHATVNTREIPNWTPPPPPVDYEVRFRGELLADGFNESDSKIISKVVDHAIRLEREVLASQPATPVREDEGLAGEGKQ